MTLRPMARPDAGVMSAMNQIEANRRLRMASQESAEGARIVVVKQVRRHHNPHRSLCEPQYRRCGL